MNVYEIVTDRIIEQLSQGKVPWRKPWNTETGKPRSIHGHYYQGINLFLLACSNYSSPIWLTYDQAAKHGGHVKKGEKSTLVTFWKRIEKQVDGETETFPILRYYSVFNLDQCENVSVPEKLISKEQTTFTHDSIQAAELVINYMPNKPVCQSIKQDSAYYKPSEDIVNVPDKSHFPILEEYYSTYFHELAHSTGHVSRLNRGEIMDHNFFASHAYSKEELTAEMTACYLNTTCGIETKTEENSIAYLQSWISRLKNDSKFIITAASKAQKAADYILKAQVQP